MARNFHGGSGIDSVESPATPFAGIVGNFSVGVWAWLNAASATNIVFWDIDDTSGGGSIVTYIAGAQAGGATKTSVIYGAQGTFNAGTINFPLQTWTYMAWNFDSIGHTTSYLGGTLDYSNVGVSFSGFAGIRKLCVGSNDPSPGPPAGAWNGYLADFAFWNNMNLTTTEIAALNAGARPSEIRPSNLMVWYPLDGLQSPEPDLSGNARNGTVNLTEPAFGPPMMQLTPRWPQIAPSLLTNPLQQLDWPNPGLPNRYSTAWNQGPAIPLVPPGPTLFAQSIL